MQQRDNILMIGYWPPPYFGPSVVYHALIASAFAQRFAVTFVDIKVAKHIRDIESFRLGKLWRMLRFTLAELRHLATRRFAFCCLPVSTNRNAFLKEVLLSRLAGWFGVPTVLYAHNNGFANFYDAASPRLQRLIDRTVSRAAGAIVMGENLRGNFSHWLPPERIFVVGVGLEPAEIPPRRPRSGAECLVLFLSNLIREKGVFVLLEAIVKLAPQRPQLRFVFAGSWFRPQEQQQAEQFIRAHRLGDRIQFCGVVWGTAKWQWLADADLLAFPTFYPNEAHPVVLVEALEAGLPVVTTARAAIPEIIQDGINGLLVREQDPADLAEKILRLVDDPALRQAMATANRQRFLARYTHEQFGRNMIKVFETLAAARRVGWTSARPSA